MSHRYFDVDRPLVIGHRGAAGTHPENTLASFAAALDQGAQILESDIHVSRDGVPLLLHDPDVARVTDGEGLAAELDYAAIAELDAGFRFTTEDGATPYRGAGHRIPSLEAAFAAFPDARFNLEVKCPDEAAIAATLDLVARFDRADHTLLAAGEDEVMTRLRRALAAHPVAPAVGASLAEIVAAIASALGRGAMPEGVDALQIPAEFGGQPLATPVLIEHAHAHGVEVHVWTVNDLAEIEALVDRGVDGVVTDFPGRVCDWVSARAGRGNRQERG